ncbi:hypothetical protein WISP_09383 [Willisornis vidua]|uniref:Uncharacterized protein n=1 Tax=Willisornis vidua TaxID=1566151 RepID=A0ABQ9DSF8_9PASS|nr:hypothetical protein WISP_09383 [Willisornis vidua]
MPRQLLDICKVGVTRIETMLMRTQLFWAGHGSRMEDHCLLKTVLYGELATGSFKNPEEEIQGLPGTTAKPWPH